MTRPKKKPKRKTIKTASKMADRGDNGQFVAGHAGGPGRPTKEVEAAYLDVFRATITPDELKIVLVKLLALAKEGDCRAAEILLKRTIPEKVFVQAAISAAVTIQEDPFDPLAAYAGDPELMARALQVERDFEAARRDQKRASAEARGDTIEPSYVET